MQNDKTFFNVTSKLKKYIIAHSTASPTRFDNCILQLRLSLTFFKDGKKKKAYCMTFTQYAFQQVILTDNYLITFTIRPSLILTMFSPCCI